MVGLNGSALSYEYEQRQIAFNATHAPSDPKNNPPRRTRSTQAARGPKPLLPKTLKEALQLAELLSKSKLTPKGFETPETCLVGILYGMEVGLSPIAALQRMAVIDGRPTIWGDAALALVQASGLLQSIKEDVMVEPQGDADAVTACVMGSTGSSTSPTRTSTANLKAICTVRREGRSEPVIGSFSIDDAKRAGLWQKPGPWTDYPKRMLIMRARAFALRDAFPDVLAGLYIREEFVGKERQAAKSEQDRSADDAEWNALEDSKLGLEQNWYGSTTDHPLKDASLAPDPMRATYAAEPKPDAYQPLSDPQQKELATSPNRRAPPPPSYNEDLENKQSETTVNKNAAVRPADMALEGNKNSLRRDPQSPLNAYSSNWDAESSASADYHIDPDTLLDFLDSALCCALDLPTLKEIVDDFAGRLSPLSKVEQKQAQKVIDRHHRRVENLDRTRQTQSEDIPTNGSLPNAKLPRGLKSLLPSLGIGRKSSTRRIETRGQRLSRSLASWNARQPLISSNPKIEDREEVPAPDKTPKVSE